MGGSDHRAALDRVINETVAPNAATVDSTGTFPADAGPALGAAGLLGLASATEVGGGGQGMRVVVEVVERLAGGVRVDGDGRPDPLRRDGRRRGVRAGSDPAGDRRRYP